jgi:hypothetical protein
MKHSALFRSALALALTAFVVIRRFDDPDLFEKYFQTAE